MNALFLVAHCLLALPHPVAAERSPAPPDAGRTYSIPYRLTDTKHIFVRAKVNGHGPYNFVMDTGAPDLFFAAERASEAGCHVDAEGRATIASLQIEGGPALRDMKARVEELFQLRSMNAIDVAGVRIDGVMGYTVLARFRIQIDLQQDDMRWTRLAYVPPPPPTISQITQGKPLPAATDVKNMEGLAKWATSMFQRKPAQPPIARGFLGIELEPGSGPPRIARLYPGGPATKAGLMPGDRIQSVELPPNDPVEIASVADLRNATAQLHPGDTVTITVERAGVKQKVRIVAETGVL